MLETNSSSVHSICIAKSDVDNFPKAVSFSFGSYGWDEQILFESERANYLYTAIVKYAYRRINDNWELCNGTGHNNLGEILIQIRDELRYNLSVAKK